MQYKIIIPGDPQSLHRPRFSRRLGRCYDPQSDLKNSLTYHIANQWKQSPLRDAVECHFIFFIQLPKSMSKKRQNLLNGMPCLKHVDLSNLIKMFEDCSNGVIYTDDSQIIRLSAEKIWSTEPRTEVEIVYN